MTEDTIAVSDFGVEFTPSRIAIKNEDVLKAQLEGISKKYTGLIVTEDNLASVKSTRAMLNKLNKGLEDKRKEIKKAYNEPLSEFENKVRGFENIISKSLDPIDESIKKLEDDQRDSRRINVQKVIDEMAPAYGIDPNAIEIENSWTNKTMTELKLTKILADGFNALKRKKDLFETNKKLVEEHAKYVGVESDGWVSQLSNDYNATAVIKAMDQSIEDRKQKELKEQKRKEAELAVQKALYKTVSDKTINKETGEVISKPDRYSVEIRLTGSKANIIQAVQKINSLTSINKEVIKSLSLMED